MRGPATDLFPLRAAPEDDMANEPNQCAHPSCQCPRGADSEYCSDYCEQTEDVTESRCDCGHAECSLAT